MLLRQKSLRLLVLLAITSTSLTSCLKEIDEYETPSPSSNPVNDMSELLVPDNFDYTVDKNYQITLKLKANDDSPLSGVVVRILDDASENSGNELFKGATNANGELVANLKVAKGKTEVFINSEMPGIPDDIIASLTGTSTSITIGGSNPQRLSCYDKGENSHSFESNNFRANAVPTKKYLSTWNTLGVPANLATPRDVISSSFLQRINNSLPDKKSVPAYHPTYLSSTANSTTLITQKADIWMTFVHEGSANRNTIAYYAYNKNNPPKTAADINFINVVFPNLSFVNSGGGLVSGDKVYLGSFGPDTVLGFVMLTNAYNRNSYTVGIGASQFYSNPELNPETNVNNRKHIVALWDLPTQKMVIGFEETNRAGGDNDFNDAIYYLTSSPANAIYTRNVVNTIAPNDSDGDGIADASDDYPNDINLAFNSYYPSKATYGHLAFEDLWPYRGDFDMNDLIVGYRYNTIKNSGNDVMAVQSSIYVKAVGGSYQNGFGFELPVNPSDVSMVIGQSLKDGYINLNGNATEAGQNKAVVIAFDNALNLAPRPGGFYVNTESGSPVVQSDTINVTTWFNHPIPSSTIGSAPFNPFMISNKRRGYEIHLPNNPPTTLASSALFNTGNDKTNTSTGRYYLSDKNLPWALNIPAAFPIVIEKNQIIKGYLKFQPWCQSGGTSYNDWYVNNTGYRDPNKLLFR
jgi:LruC domain-containing protein